MIRVRTPSPVFFKPVPSRVAILSSCGEHPSKVSEAFPAARALLEVAYGTSLRHCVRNLAEPDPVRRSCVAAHQEPVWVNHTPGPATLRLEPAPACRWKYRSSSAARESKPAPAVRCDTEDEPGCSPRRRVSAIFAGSSTQNRPAAARINISCPPIARSATALALSMTKSARLPLSRSAARVDGDIHGATQACTRSCAEGQRDSAAPSPNWVIDCRAQFAYTVSVRSVASDGNAEVRHGRLQCCRLSAVTSVRRSVREQ